MEKELKVLLSLGMAKKWYNSEDKELKTLALTVYTKEELEYVSIQEIIDKALTYNIDDKLQANNMINVIATYFNKGWNKSCNEEGYFWQYDYNYNKWIVTKHISSAYPCLVYYKDIATANKAFEYAKEYYEILITK